MTTSPDEPAWGVPPDTVVLLREEEDPHAEVQRVVLLATGTALLLPAWSSLERLVELAGCGKPWMAMSSGQLEDLRQQLGALVVLDPVWPPELPAASSP